MRSFSLRELYREAQVMVVGEVVGSECLWNEAHDTIYTHYRVRVERVLKGTAGGEVTVRLMGGTVGDTTLAVAGNPSIERGERVLLALRDFGKFHTVVGMSQGKWSLRQRDGKELAWRGAALGDRPVQDGEIELDSLVRTMKSED